MSPAGHWPQLHAAIESGADAVYFGLKHFSARAKTGFSLDELPSAMRALHARGVSGFLTFNTLVFEHELSEAANTVAKIAESAVDAMIVQDYGIVHLIREIAPSMELHGSTQMSITDVHGVKLAQSHGIQRVNLARELSLDEIRAIIAETDCELEMFVHGALCVAYSGQCFSSEAWGGRSANRGKCAQACRLPYELLVDHRVQPLADARYLLSPGDLFALEQIPEIVETGVAALKIEGRYKDADYVALTTRAYRQAIDQAWAARPAPIDPRQKLQLEQIYSRGLGPFFITGTNHQQVVSGRAPRHRGVLMGRVERVDAKQIIVSPTEAHAIAPLKPGDGVVFDAADWRSPEEPEEGGRLYQVVPARDGNLELRFGNGVVKTSRIRPGDLLWRTDDPDLARAVRSLPQTRQLVDVHVIANIDEPLTTHWSLSKNPSVAVTITSPTPLTPAEKRGLSLDALREQFSRLGNTAYTLGTLTLDAPAPAFIPIAALNQIRRQAIEELESLQTKPQPPEIRDPERALHRVLNRDQPAPAIDPAPPELHILVRTPDQLTAALATNPASITLDHLDLYGLRPSIERVKSSGISARVAAPRVLKPGESRILNFLLSLNCPILIRSTGALHALRDREHPDLIGDFSLNTANSITAALYLDLGITRITPTHDLNAAQIASLARDIGPDRIEAIAYQHLPVFHTEHCVFCRFLSTGTSYRDCGRPCEKHELHLKDSAGRAHPVIADVGCRNTVFGAEAQDASTSLDSWRRAGIRHFRLEFASETADQVRDVIRAWDAALAGRMPASKLAAELKTIAPQGTALGSLFVPDDYRKLPILQ